MLITQMVYYGFEVICRELTIIAAVSIHGCKYKQKYTSGGIERDWPVVRTLAATGWHFICISPYECGEIFAKQDGEEQMDRQTLGL